MPARKTARKTTQLRSARQPVQIKRKPTHFKHMFYSRAEALSKIFLREIVRNYSDAMFFTREDLLQLPTFGHISTISRYQTVCTLVDFLITSGEIISKTKTNLCLKSKSNYYETTPLQEQFFETIRTVISTFKKTPFIVMDVVGEWKTDPHLTINNKRVAVRLSMRRLVREGTVTDNDDMTYTYKGK